LAGCVAPADAATTVSGRFSLDILFNEVISSGNQKSGVLQSRFADLVDLSTGTADNQVNVAYAKTETGISASTTTVYDLVGGLTSTDGTTLNFDEVVLVAVRNKSSTAANYLTVGPDATNGFGVIASNKGFWADASDRSVLAADGNSWLVLHSKGGVPAAAGSTDELAVITQSSTSANTWDLLVLGRDN
ncbi:MAG: hypothetical protein EBS48_10425, partial [Actinobacteria bacterium]|nr:hypothetical protein [Actinomycetota bacterium]